jgi:hypothetical protein
MGKTYPIKLTIAGDVFPMVTDIIVDMDKKSAELSLRGFLNGLPALGKSFGLDLPEIARSDISISASFGKKRLTVKNFSMKTRRSNVMISGRGDFSGKKPKIDAKIKSDNFDITEFFPKLYGGRNKWIHPDRPLNVFKDIPLFGEFLPTIDADISLSANWLNMYRKLFAKNVSVGVRIKDSRAIIEAGAGFMGGSIKTKTRIREEDGGMLRVVAAGFGRKIAIGSILESVEEEDYISDLPSDFDFYMRGQGYELSDVMKTATGLVRINSIDGGYAHEGLIEFLYGQDFLTSLRDSIGGIFNSRKKNSQMRIHCATANLKIRNGRLDMNRNVAVQTQAVNIRATGNVDFGNETMNIALDTVPTQGIKLSLSGNVINSLELSGNIAEPKLALNQKVLDKIATAASLGIAVGALTGGIGMLVGAGIGLVGGDVVTNWTEDGNPCQTALKDGAPESRRGDPDFLGQPINQLVESAMGTD